MLGQSLMYTSAGNRGKTGGLQTCLWQTTVLDVVTYTLVVLQMASFSMQIRNDLVVSGFTKVHCVPK